MFGKKDGALFLTEYLGNDEELVLPDNVNNNHYELYGDAKINKTFSVLNTGNGITDLPQFMFFNNLNLNEVTIGTNIQTAGAGVFMACSNLKTLNYNAVHFENKETEQYVDIYDENGVRWFTNIPLGFPSITTLNFGKDVEYIPNRMVRDNQNLTTVNFADGIKAHAIEEYSFSGCANLQSIDLKNILSIGDAAFNQCGAINNLNLESVTTIGRYAFQLCTGLEEVTIGKDFTSAGDRVFYNCINIKTLNYNASHFENKSVNSYYPFEFPSITTLNFGEDVEYIPSNMVRRNKNLTTVNLADSIKVQAIGDNMFNGCTNLQSVDAKTIQSIGNSAFYQCSSLQSIDLKNVQTVGNNAFYQCSSLQSIDLKNTQSIGDKAFYQCSAIDSLNLENITTIGEYAFYACTGLEEVTIGKNLSSAGDKVFSNCNNIKTLNYNVSYFDNQNVSLSFPSIITLNLGKDVEYIPNRMVRGNQNLKTVNLADGIKVQTIEGFTFNGCSSLQSINLYEEPNEDLMTEGVCIKNIGDRAFVGCSELTSLDLRGVETIGNSAFGSLRASNIMLGKNVNSIGDYAFSFYAPLDKLTVGNNYGLNYMLGMGYYDNENWLLVPGVIKNLVIAEDFAETSLTGDFSSQSLLETIECKTVEPLAFELSSPFTDEQYESIALTVPEESIEAYKAARIWQLFCLGGDDHIIKLYNGNSDKLLIVHSGAERPEEASAENAMIFIGKQLEDDSELLGMGNVIYRDEQNQWVSKEINLSDAKPFYTPADVKVGTLAYTRNFDAATWQALYLPFSLSYDEWKDVADVAYVNNVHQWDDNNDGEIDRTVLEFITKQSGSLQANIPYVIRPKQTGEVTFTTGSATLYATPETDGFVDCRSTTTEYTLYGTYQEKMDMYENGYYGMSDGYFMYADSPSFILSPFRAYLKVESRYGSGAVQKAPQRISVMVDGIIDGETAIDGVPSEDSCSQSGAYNLAGQKVSSDFRGLVVKRGKKVIMKN